jgi:cystathionine gamma-synthase
VLVGRAARGKSWGIVSADEESPHLPQPGPSTLSVHGGEPRVRVGRSITEPLVLASTYPFEDTAELHAFMRRELERPEEYGRYGNPTVAAVEAKLAALEGGGEDGYSAVLMASGMAAITSTLLAMLRTGAHVVFTADVYRKTRVFARTYLKKFGVEVDIVEPSLAAIEAAVREQTKVIFTEAPTNPYLRVVDLEGVVALAKARRIKTIVDATFATPINMRPCRLGVDLVIHSTTKYLGGHNDLLGGVVVGRGGLVDAIREQLGTLGAVCDPHNAFLLGRGLKTLALRVQRHNESALALARMLDEHPKVSRVWYPLLESHEDHENACRVLSGGGGVVSFELAGGLEAGSRLVDAVRIPKLAPSLGGVESLIEQPALMSFYDQGPEGRAALGIREGLIRLSVGIEDLADLRADLLTALEQV